MAIRCLVNENRTTQIEERQLKVQEEKKQHLSTSTVFYCFFSLSLLNIPQGLSLRVRGKRAQHGARPSNKIECSWESKNAVLTDEKNYRKLSISVFVPKLSISVRSICTEVKLESVKAKTTHDVFTSF
jgi:hypothetical protein